MSSLLLRSVFKLLEAWSLRLSTSGQTIVSLKHTSNLWRKMSALCLPRIKVSLHKPEVYSRHISLLHILWIPNKLTYNNHWCNVLWLQYTLQGPFNHIILNIYHSNCRIRCMIGRNIFAGTSSGITLKMVVWILCQLTSTENHIDWSFNWSVIV